jgi:uncharacterized protein YxjI
MIYKVKEKFWSIGNSFSITDSDGETKFFVKGNAFSWGDRLSFQNERNEELAVIDQKLFSFKPKYQILIGGSVFAEIVKEWSWLGKKFTLDVPGPNDYKIEGSFWDHEFTFFRNDTVAAKVTRKLFNLTDTYSVEISDDEDAVSILCTCIVIDQILHDENKQ